MPMRLIVVFMLATLLGACYKSEHQLFSAEGGVKMPLPDGVYSCLNENPKYPPSRAIVRSQNKGGKYLYTWWWEKSTNKKNDISFHNIAKNRYIEVSRDVIEGRATEAQTISIIQVTNNAIQWLAIDRSRENAVADKHEIKFISGSVPTLVGTPEKQRAFISAVAIEQIEKIVQTCTFDH